MTNFVFNPHKEIGKDDHAIISPSRHNVKPGMTDEQFDAYICSIWSTTIGTALHDLAATIITKRVRISSGREMQHDIDIALCKAGVPMNVNYNPTLPETLIMYTKDCIGFDMSIEQPLAYSKWVFGRADAISFNPRKGELKIFDLKTGKVPASLDQLLQYAAIFFLEYNIKPGEVKTELDIYQNGDILTGLPKASDILPQMDEFKKRSKYCDEKYGRE